MRNGVRPKGEKTLKRMEIGSGNVFADLAVPEPEECLAKAKLVCMGSLRDSRSTGCSVS
jgi:hypothetical protein